MWRIAAINEAGGWKDRTTVEDMDLAVRASLKGWKFVYLGSLQVSFFYLWYLFSASIHRSNCGNLLESRNMHAFKKAKIS